MKNDVECGLKIVLGLIEETGVDPVGFKAHGKPRMQAIVETNAGLRGEGAAAVAGCLRLQVRTTH